MKKSLIVFMAIMLLAMTGCGNTKTLTCTAEEDGQKTVVTMKFKDDKLTTMVQDMTLEFDNELEESEQTMVKSYLDLACSAYDYDGVECKVSASAKSASIYLSIDITKLNDEAKEELEYSGDETYDSLKNEAEEDGYTCK